MRRRGVDPCAYVPGLYTEAEVDDLINIDGYIPVASAVEFDKIRTGASETMGGCTIWAGTYTTGVTEKYVQVAPIDLSSFAPWAAILSFEGIFDGNELDITNHSGQYLFENSSTSNPYQLRNIRDVSCAIDGNIAPAGSHGAIARNAIAGAILENIYVSGSVTGSVGTVFGVGGIVGITLDGTTAVSIQNCHFEGIITGSHNVGGLVGIAENLNISGSTIINSTVQNDLTAAPGTATDSGGLIGVTRVKECTITDCHVINTTFFGRGLRCGGFIGVDSVITTIEDSTVSNCTMTFNGLRLTGGFVGVLSTTGSTISRSYATGSAVTTGTTDGHGGFVGVNIRTIRECYADVNVTAPSSSGSHFGTGGFVGDNRAGSVIEDCYAYGTVLGRNEVGGFAGRGNGTIRYSYSTGSATGNTNVGGFIGRVTTTNSQTAAYWDTVTSGNATSAGAGTSGQTTSDLQTPTSNTGIYAAWTIPPWDFGTSTDYPVLTTTP